MKENEIKIEGSVTSTATNEQTLAALKAMAQATTRYSQLGDLLSQRLFTWVDRKLQANEPLDVMALLEAQENLRFWSEQQVSNLRSDMKTLQKIHDMETLSLRTQIKTMEEGQSKAMDELAEAYQVKIAEDKGENSLLRQKLEKISGELKAAQDFNHYRTALREINEKIVKLFNE